MSPWIKRLFTLLIFAAVIGGGAWYYLKKRSAAPNVQFRTATVARGDIVQEVMANGSLTPVKNVQVGSQVSGIIEKINVDYNSSVKEGDVIAQIDPSTYQQNLVQANAELAQAQSALELAEIQAKRADELYKDKLISASDHDTAVAAYHQAQAGLKTKEASVYRAKVDLSRTTINAPISGVVISRAVDQGQTVAASFNTPTLFLIANDLTKMQIEAAVSEADVGGVDEGEKVTFSVEAFPNRKFVGQVQQVRFAPITNQNVVTYTAVIQVDNKDLKLRPGMTATARIMTAQKTNVVKVPNAALRLRLPAGVTVVGATNSASGGGTNRTAVALDSTGTPIPPWRAEGRRPTPEERQKFEASLTPDQRERYQQMMQQMRQRFAEAGGGPGGMGPGGPGGGSGGSARRTEGPTTATVYLLESPGKEGQEKPVLRAVTVKAGITDGTSTEILEGLKEGEVVVTGATTTAAAASTNEPPRNPFMPFGGRR